MRTEHQQRMDSKSDAAAASSFQHRSDAGPRVIRGGAGQYSADNNAPSATPQPKALRGGNKLNRADGSSSPEIIISHIPEAPPSASSAASSISPANTALKGSSITSSIFARFQSLGISSRTLNTTS